MPDLTAASAAPLQKEKLNGKPPYATEAPKAPAKKKGIGHRLNAMRYKTNG